MSWEMIHREALLRQEKRRIRDMAKEARVWEVIKNAGYEPIENKSIIVSYAPENLSDAGDHYAGWKLAQQEHGRDAEDVKRDSCKTAGK